MEAGGRTVLSTRECDTERCGQRAEQGANYVRNAQACSRAAFVLLVNDMAAAQHVRHFAAIRRAFRQERIAPTHTLRPWTSWT